MLLAAPVGVSGRKDGRGFLTREPRTTQARPLAVFEGDPRRGIGRKVPVADRPSEHSFQARKIGVLHGFGRDGPPRSRVHFGKPVILETDHILRVTREASSCPRKATSFRMVFPYDSRVLDVTPVACASRHHASTSPVNVRPLPAPTLGGAPFAGLAGTHSGNLSGRLSAV